MQTRETDQTREPDIHLGRLVELLGTAVLVCVVAFPLSIWFYYFLSQGVYDGLHKGSYSPLRGIELVAIPLGAVAGAWLRWGAGRIAALRARRVGPLLPLLAAVVLFAMLFYTVYWWIPHGDVGDAPASPVQRSIGAALWAAVAYAGMLLFPRLTATLAGAIAGPALVAVVGYTFFPSFIRYPESRLTDGELSGTLALGSLAVAAGGALAMLLSKRARRSRPLSYALWMGAVMLMMAVAGTLHPWDIGR